MEEICHTIINNAAFIVKQRLVLGKLISDRGGRLRQWATHSDEKNEE